MTIRFVWLWTALSVAATAIVLGAVHIARPAGYYPASELLTALSLGAIPLAQYVALRAAHIDWRREWSFATLTGDIFASTASDLPRSPLLAPGLQFSFAGYVILSAVIVTALRWIVLRKHTARAHWWPAAGAAVWAISRAGQWLAFGTPFPRSTGNPMFRLAIVGVASLVEAACLTWIVAGARDDAGSGRHADRGWLVIEWIAGGAMSVLVIMGVAGVIEIIFRQRPAAAAVLARPVFAGFTGLVIGATQRMLLRARFAVTWHLIPVSVAALAGPSLGILIPLIGAFVFYGWLFAVQTPGGLAVLGAWFGFCQWLVLRRSVSRSSAWIPATALAWASMHLRGWPASLSYTTTGATAGAIFGAAMLVMLPRHQDAWPRRSSVRS